MAGTIIAASPLITRLEGQSLGYVGATLSNFDTDAEPQIIGNFEIAGSIGSFASLESITGWAALANGTAYIKIVPDTTAGTCTAEFTATAPTWDNAKMGWYGTGANANHRYLFKLTKGGASLWSDKSFLEVQGKYQNVTVENDLTVGGGISGATINTGLGDFEIGQNLRTTDSPTFAGANFNGGISPTASFVGGFQSVGAGAEYTLPRGAYNIIPGWPTIAVKFTGFGATIQVSLAGCAIFSDGVNVKIVNTDSVARNFYYQKY
jgi:hypothetical protein